MGAVEIPAEIDGKPVTSIGNAAFDHCISLTSVSIPESVTKIGASAFLHCSGLTSAMFLGDAPNTFAPNAFNDTWSGFSIYYLSGRTGFTSPTWNGYPSVMLDAVPPPPGLWLLAYNLPLGTDLHQDINDDGVSLFMAYALNLNPNLNLRSSLPEPILGDSTLSLSFYAAAPGITYRVYTSSDLKVWTTAGVILPNIEPGGQRTASISLGGAKRFMRLVVAE